MGFWVKRVQLEELLGVNRPAVDSLRIDYGFATFRMAGRVGISSCPRLGSNPDHTRQELSKACLHSNARTLT